MEEKLRNPMYEKTTEKVKSLLKTALATYCIIGSLYYAPLTGHPSADIHLGLVKPTKIEKILLEEFGYENKNHQNELNTEIERR